MTGTSVVVGVSRRSTSEPALRWAADEAARRGAGLVVVRAWRPSAAEAGSRATATHATSDRQAAFEQAQRALHADVEGVLGVDHGAEVLLVFGGKRRALLEAARQADLLVIEAPRPLASSSGPSFVSRLVARTACPVVVVPRGETGTVRKRAAAAGKRVTEAAGRAPRAGLGHVQPPR